MRGSCHSKNKRSSLVSSRLFKQVAAGVLAAGLGIGLSSDVAQASYVLENGYYTGNVDLMGNPYIEQDGSYIQSTTGDVSEGWVKIGSTAYLSNEPRVKSDDYGTSTTIKFFNVYGAYTESGEVFYKKLGDDDSWDGETYNTNIEGEAYKIVAGGYTLSGSAHDNYVNISGKVISGAEEESTWYTTTDQTYINTITKTYTSPEIYGGRGSGADSEEYGNVVNVSGTVQGSIYGGYVAHQDDNSTSAYENTIYISGTVYEPTVSYSIAGETVENTYYFKKTSEIKGSNIIGGYGDCANYNNVVIGDDKNSSASVTSAVYGGYSVANVSGYASGNAVTIKSGATVWKSSTDKIGKEYDWYWSSSGSTESDILNNPATTSTDVTANDTSNMQDYNQNIYGGYAEAGATNANQVVIEGTVYTDVYGGYSVQGDSSANEVTISGAAYKNVYGGNAKDDNAIENKVTISGTVGTSDNPSNIYGGYTVGGCAGYSQTSPLDNTQIVKYGNTVEVTEGTVVGNIYGGYADDEASCNTINISGGTITGYIYGGYNNADGDANYNTINISGGTIKGNVYGGYSVNEDGDTENAGMKENIISVSGTTAVLYDAALYGINVAPSTNIETDTDNTLSIDGWTGTINAINNFNNIEFLNVDATKSGIVVTNSSSIAGTAVTVKSISGLNLSYGGTYDVLSGTNLTTDDKTTFSVTGLSSYSASSLLSDGTGVALAGLSTAVKTNSLTIVADQAKFLVGSYSPSSSSTLVKTSDGTLTVDGKSTAATNFITSMGENAKVAGYYAAGAGNAASGGDITISTAYTGNVYGGYSEKSTASNNTVTINANVTGDVYGGYGTGYSGNTIKLNGGNVSGTVYAGAGERSYATNMGGNTLEVDKSATIGALANFSTSGKINIKENAAGDTKLTIDSTGSTKITSTTVTVDLTDFTGTLDSAGKTAITVGGTLVDSGNTEATQTKYQVTGLTDDLYAQASENYVYASEVEVGKNDNDIIFKLGKTQVIAGSYTDSASKSFKSTATGKEGQLTLGAADQFSSLTLADNVVYAGAYAKAGEASNGTVNLNAILTGLTTLYGGYAVDGTSASTGNTINVGSGIASGALASIALWGSNITAASASNNTLNLNSYTGSISTVKNFNTINMTGVKISSLNTGSVVTLGSDSDLSGTTVNLTVTDLSKLSSLADGTYNIISGGTYDTGSSLVIKDSEGNAYRGSSLAYAIPGYVAVSGTTVGQIIDSDNKVTGLGITKGSITFAGTVNITGSAYNSDNKDTYAAGTLVVDNDLVNTVIPASSPKVEYLTGAYSISNYNATGGKVSILSAYAGTIYGGYVAGTGSVINNTIDVDTTTKDALANTILIGTNKDMSATNNNVLNLNSYTGSIKEVSKFNTINIGAITISAGTNSDAVLTLANETETDLAGTTIKVAGVDYSAMTDGTKTLISGKNLDKATFEIAGLTDSVIGSGTSQLQVSGATKYVATDGTALGITKSEKALTGVYVASDGTTTTAVDSTLKLTSSTTVGSGMVVTGAYSVGSQNATGGTVDVSGAYAGTIYAGYAEDAENGKANGNTVKVEAAADLSSTELKGSNVSSSTGNTLDLSSWSGTVKFISGFNNVALNAAGTATVSATADLSGATVKATGVDIDEVLKATNKTLTLLTDANGITTNSSTAYDLNGTGKNSASTTKASANYVEAGTITLGEASDQKSIVATGKAVIAGTYIQDGVTTKSTASGNEGTLTLDANTPANADAYAGVYSDADAKGVTTNITGGTYDTVYGGYSTANGEVSGNTVNVSGGTVSNLIVGYSAKTDGTNDYTKVTNNSVVVSGSGTVSNIDLVNAAGNNTIVIKGSSATVGSIDYGEGATEETKTETDLVDGGTLAGDPDKVTKVDTIVTKTSEGGTTQESTIGSNDPSAKSVTIEANNVDVAKTNVASNATLNTETAKFTDGSTINGTLNATTATLEDSTINGTLNATGENASASLTNSKVTGSVNASKIDVTGGSVEGTDNKPASITATGTDGVSLSNTNVNQYATIDASGTQANITGGDLEGKLKAGKAVLDGTTNKITTGSTTNLSGTESLTAKGTTINGTISDTGALNVSDGSILATTSANVTSLNLDESSKITGNLNASGDVELDGTVGNTDDSSVNASVSAKSAAINGTLAKGSTINVETATFGSNAKVGGEVDITGDNATISISGGDFSGKIMETGAKAITNITGGNIGGEVDITGDNATTNISGGDFSGKLIESGASSTTNITGGNIGGTIQVTGSNAVVNISNGAKITGKITGATGADGTVDNNTVNISGGQVGDENSTDSDSTEIIANEIDTTDGAKVVNATLAAHTINLSNLSGTGVVLKLTGSTLNVYKDISASIKKIELPEAETSASGTTRAVFNFYIPDNEAAGSTMLNITDNSNISYSTVNAAVVKSGSEATLKSGDTVNLISDAAGLVTTGVNYNGSSSDHSWMDATHTFYRSVAISEVKDAASGNVTAIQAKVGDTQVNDDVAKSSVETQTAVTGMLNSTADMIADQGFINAANASSAMAPFFAVGGSNLRYNTGSHVDTKGLNMVLGFAKTVKNDCGSLMFGPMIAYGRGSYDSYVGDVHGSGNTSAWGIGFLAKETYKSGTYLEGSIQAGRTKSDYNGASGSYDNDAAYYGFHLGVGQLQPVSDHSSIDYYGKFFYNHQNGSHVTLNNAAENTEYSFNPVNSKRLRLGGRYNVNVSKLSTLYAGLAWQYEFGGDANATIFDASGNAYGAPSPSLKGGSAMYEFGWQYKPADQDLTIDLGITGYNGIQKGVAFGLKLNFGF